MTSQQLENLRTLSAPLVENPLPWVDLSEEQQAAFRALMPSPYFTEDQRYYLALWWLPVTESIVETLNELCPDNTSISPREDINGNLWVNVDLLSDAFDNGRLSALLPILENLPIIYKEEEWPQPSYDDLL